MNTRFAAILVLLVCWAFTAALTAQVSIGSNTPTASNTASGTASTTVTATASVSALSTDSTTASATVSTTVPAVSASGTASTTATATVSTSLSLTASPVAPSGTPTSNQTVSPVAPSVASATPSALPSDIPTVSNSISGSVPSANPSAISSGSITTSWTPVAATCDDVYDCVSEGKSCVNSWASLTDYLNCTKYNGTGCCAYGLGCFSGECATNNLGAACSDAVPCASYAGEALGCSGGVCKYFSLAGDSCEDDDDTYCATGLTCTSGVCTGQALNAACNVNLPCNNGLFCEFDTTTLASTCQNLQAEGQACVPTQCAANLFCLAVNATVSVCTKEHTLDEGEACTVTAQCDNDYKCINGKCAEATEKFTTCSTNSDCSNGAVCQCSLFTGDLICTGGTDVADPCVEARADASDCSSKNNCTSQSLNENSCFYENCYSELKDLQSCGCGNYDTFYSSCFYNDYCGGFPGWAIALIIIGAVAIVLAIVAVIFVAMKRKNTYDSI